MRRRAALVPLLIAGCAVQPLTGDHVCHDVVVAVAARVAACAGDSEAASEVDDAFEDQTCLLEGDDPEDYEGFEAGLYDCVGAMSQVPCEAAVENAENPAFWLAQDFHCAQIYGDEPADTGSPL